MVPMTLARPNVETLMIGPESTVRDAALCIDRGARGIALVVDGRRRLLATITDGDIRRGLLAGVDLDDPVTVLVQRKEGTRYARPVTAPVGIPRAAVIHLMKEKGVRHVPLLDAEGRVVELAALDDLLPDEQLPMQAIIMAGGFGTRLRPLTDHVPKPMLPVGDKPLLEWILRSLRGAGIRRVSITTHYKAEQITRYFGDGSDFGVHLSYVVEEHPLGTAGALRLLDPPEEPVLIINGDILTRVDVRAMLNFHQEHEAELTVAVRPYEHRVPFGVVDCDGPNVCRLVEKPLQTCLVAAGIYLLSPSVWDLIPAGRPVDMPELVQAAVAGGRNVVSFPVVEYWRDIGQPADYAAAQEDVVTGRLAP
ncbi:MAG TPA: nucleotidyltransferase family protein [Bacillota bacterium]